MQKLENTQAGLEKKGRDRSYKGRSNKGGSPDSNPKIRAKKEENTGAPEEGSLGDVFPTSSPAKPKSRPRFTSLDIIVIVIISTLLALSLIPWPTHIKIDAKVNGAIFETVKEVTGDANSEIPIIGSLQAKSIHISRFMPFEITPKKLRLGAVVNPNLPIDNNNLNWVDLSFDATPLRIAYPQGKEDLDLPAITLVSSTGSPIGSPKLTPLDLKGILVKSKSVVKLKAKDNKTSLLLSVNVNDNESSTAFIPASNMQLIATNCKIEGVQYPGKLQDDNGQNIYALEFGDDPLRVDIQGNREAVEYIITPYDMRITNFIPKAVIPISAMDLSEPSGNESLDSLIIEAAISYPEHSKVSEVKLNSTAILKLDKLKKFQIQELNWDADSKFMHLIAEGVAGEAMSKIGQRDQDLRLSVLDQICRNSKVDNLYLIIAAFVSTFIVIVLKRRELQAKQK